MTLRIFGQTFDKVVAIGGALNPTLVAKTVTILVSLLAAIPPSQADTHCRLAILGDSLTAGYGVQEQEAFPAQLADRLAVEGVQCEIVDAGVSGDTTAGGASRIAWVLADEPTHLLIELGGNDALRALPTTQMRANLAKIIQTAQDRNVYVMLAGMLAPPNLGPQYGDGFAHVFAELAHEFTVPLYDFFLDGVAGQRELLIEDGIHPNADGVAIIVERIAPQILEFLSSR